MCFSLEISLSTFLFSWITSFYLLNKNLTEFQRKNVIFLMIFSLMQLADVILWLIKMKKNNINYVVTSFVIPTILLAQVIYSLLFVNNLHNIFAYLIIALSGYILYNRYNGYSVPSKNYFESPTWGGKETNFLSMLLFFFVIFYGRIGLSGEKLQNLFIGLLTLIASFYFSGGFGSIWCALANVASLVYLFRY